MLSSTRWLPLSPRSSEQQVLSQHRRALRGSHTQVVELAIASRLRVSQAPHWKASHPAKHTRPVPLQRVRQARTPPPHHPPSATAGGCHSAQEKKTFLWGGSSTRTAW